MRGAPRRPRAAAPKSWPRLASGVQARRRTSTAFEPPQKLAMGPFAGRWELHIDALRVCPRARSGRLAGDRRVDDGDVVASLAAGCSAMTPEERAERRRAARGARERLPGTSGRGIHAGRCCVRAAGQACPGACRPWTAALVGLRWSCEVSVERFFRCVSPSTAVCGVDPSRLLMWRCPMHALRAPCGPPRAATSAGCSPQTPRAPFLCSPRYVSRFTTTLRGVHHAGFTTT